MPSKRSLVALLIGVNLLLFASLVISSYSLPAARAQAVASRSSFISVTAKPAGRSYDVLYVVDSPSRRLYAFFPAGDRENRLLVSPPRDLAEDFGR